MLGRFSLHAVDDPGRDLLAQKIRAEYDALRRIGRLDPAELDHLVEWLLPALTEMLQCTAVGPVRRLEPMVRHLVHELEFTSETDTPAGDQSHRLMRELEVRVLVRAMAHVRQEQARTGATWSDVPVTEQMCG